MLFDDGFYNGEPQSRPPDILRLSGLDAIKALENLRLLLQRNSDAVILDSHDDVITIRLYEVRAGEGSARFIAGPAVPMETRLAKEEYHGQGATPQEALQDCIDKIKDVDRRSMFEIPPPMLPPSSVGRF